MTPASVPAPHARSWFSLTCKDCKQPVTLVNEGHCVTCFPVEPCHPDDPRRIKWSAFIAGEDTR